MNDREATEPNSLTLFVDESGNTGANLLDLDQPFVSVAGVLASTTAVSALSDIVESVRRGLPTPPAELKGTRLISYTKGTEAVNRLIRETAKAGARFGVQITEKRYAIAGRAIDMFLDGALNPRAPWELLNNAGAKREIAEELVKLPDATFERVWTALGNPDRPRLEDAINALSVQMRLLGHSH